MRDSPGRIQCRSNRYLGPGLTPGTLALILVSLLQTGCITTRPLPPVDLSASGWRVRQGQGVWKPAADRPELAGDLLVATNANGDLFVQFTKNPFPLATAEITGDRWHIQFSTEPYSWHGHGAPPKRFVWFQLPRALAEAKPTGDWHFEKSGANSWRLENPRTGESLEADFFP